jgi:hypothetical protein
MKSVSMATKVICDVIQGKPVNSPEARRYMPELGQDGRFQSTTSFQRGFCSEVVATSILAQAIDLLMHSISTAARFCIRRGEQRNAYEIAIRDE